MKEMDLRTSRSVLIFQKIEPAYELRKEQICD